MDRRFLNYSQLALDLRRGIWLIHEADTFLPLINSFFSKIVINSDVETPDKTSGESSSSSKDKNIAIIPIHGALTKYDTCFNYGTLTIAEKIASYIDNKDIIGIVLDIDSPGGAVNSVAPLIEVINKVKQAGKTVIAHCDTCCSAAYWVASYCDSIYSDNKLSLTGSIGAYCTLLDDRENKQNGYKLISVYAKESTDKNLAYREALDGKPEKLQEELSLIVKEFHNDILTNRPLLKEEVLSGSTYYTSKAIELSLVDDIATLDQCVTNIIARNIT